MSNKQNSLGPVQQPQALQGDNDSVQQNNSVIMTQEKKVDNYKEWLDQLTKEKQLVYSYPIVQEEWRKNMRFFDKRNQVYGVTITFDFLKILLYNDFLESSQIQFYINIFRKIYPTIKCAAASCYFYAEFCPSSTDQLQIILPQPIQTQNKNSTNQIYELNNQFQPIKEKNSNLQIDNKEKNNQLQKVTVESTDQKNEENEEAKQSKETKAETNADIVQLKEETQQTEIEKVVQQQTSQITQQVEEEKRKEQQEHQPAAVQTKQTLPTQVGLSDANQHKSEKDPQPETNNQAEQLLGDVQTQQIEQQRTETSEAQSVKQKDIENKQDEIQQELQEVIKNQEPIVQTNQVVKHSQQTENPNVQNQNEQQENDKMINNAGQNKIPQKEDEPTDLKQGENQVPSVEIKETEQNQIKIADSEQIKIVAEYTQTKKVEQPIEQQESQIIKKDTQILMDQKEQIQAADVQNQKVEIQNEQSKQNQSELAVNKLEQHQKQKVEKSDIGNTAEQSRDEVSINAQTQTVQTESNPVPEQIQQVQPEKVSENKQQQNQDFPQQLLNTQISQPSQPQTVQQPEPIVQQPVQKKWEFKFTTFQVTPKVAEPIEGVYKLSKLDNLFQQIAEMNGISKEELGQQDYLYIPINQSQAHWISVILDLKKKEFHYFDSYYNSIDNVVKIGVDHILQKLGFTTQFKIITHFNKQQNGYDCGIFSLLSLLYTLQQKFEYDYSQVEVSQWRRRILYDLAVIGSQINLDQETFERIIEIQRS